MKLGFDLDGTVADMHAALAREARSLFPNLNPATLPDSFASGAGAPSAEEQPSPDAPAASQMDTLTSAQQRELWKVVCAQSNWWETLDEIEPGALARLHRLVTERRWELIFLTSRPDTAGDTVQIQSHRWLSAHGFQNPSVFVVHGSRGKIASALGLDVLVDDRPENCLDIAIDSQARAILVWRGEEDKVPGSARQLGIGAVTSINECLDILEQIGAESDDRPGMVERFKRLLGLKPRASRVRERAASPAGLDDSTSPPKVAAGAR